MRQQLGQVSLTAMVIASMIGAGVYTTSGFALADLQRPLWVMEAWLVGGLIAICGAISYGQLANRLLEDGGEYLYLSRFVHPAAGVVAGWVSFLAGFTGAGAYAAIAFDAYVWPLENRPAWLPNGSLAILLIIAATVLHLLGTRRGVLGQNVIVAIKLLLLGIFICVAFANFSSWQGSSQSISSDSQSWTWYKFATSVMWISLSYSGFNAAVYVAGQSRIASHDVARAMLFGTILVTLIYLLLNGIFLYAASTDRIVGQKDIAVIAATSIGGNALVVFVRIAICLGLASSVSSVLIAGPHVYAKMAAEGRFPKFFASYETAPSRAIVLQAIAMMIVVQIAGLQSLLSYLSITLALSATGTVATLFSVRSNRIQSARSLIFPSVYVVASLGLSTLSAIHNPHEAIAAAATMLFGIAVYLFSRWR